MPEPVFDELAEVYEAMIHWPKRLANEGPFFRQLFEQYGVRRVADVACGTGQHAAMFHSWGLEVQGSDLSPEMIARARAALGEPPGLRWVVQGFDQPAGPADSFDGVICVGNSLALAPNVAAADAALACMFAAARPGGLIIVHVLNLWKLPDGPCVWQKALNVDLAEGRTLVLKGVHRCGEKGYVELVLMRQGEDAPSWQSHSAPFLGMAREHLEATARAHHAAEVSFFGNHQRQPYDAGRSTDLIMAAVKA